MPTGSRSSSDAARGSRLDALIARLSGLEVDGGWVVSAYLKLEPRDRQRRKYLIKLKNRVREQLDAFAARTTDRAGRAQVRDDLERVRAYLDNQDNLPPGRGIAVFACRPVRLFEAVPLARVFRSRLIVDRTPLVRELQAVRQEFGTMLCAVLDRASARLFEVTAAGAVELPGLVAAGTAESGKFHGGRQRRTTGARGRAAGVSGVGEHNWHRRIREERQRHYAAVADRLFDYTRRQPVQGIVLGGGARDVAAVTPHLHPYLRDQLLGTARLNPQGVEPAQVVQQVLALRRTREREWERRHADALRAAVATGWGTGTVAATLDALARGQVRTLLVAADATHPGFRCRTTGRLTADPAACRGEGAVEPVADVVDEAIEEALRQRAHVHVVEDDAAQARFDGLGALLRFPRR